MDRSAHTVRNVIFDMGNVLMTFDGPAFAAQFTDTPEDAALLQRALFGSTMWSLLDSGTIGHETMARYARAHLPKRLHPNLAACIARWDRRTSSILRISSCLMARDGRKRSDG